MPAAVRADALLRAQTGLELTRGCRLADAAVLYCCTRRSIRSNYYPELWSYGDSNPRPLACHQQAGHPPESITAGHRPCGYPGVHRNPDTLRYFPAVLTGKSTGVQGRCGTSPPHTPRAPIPHESASLASVMDQVAAAGTRWPATKSGLPCRPDSRTRFEWAPSLCLLRVMWIGR
jgi:hypothetical protein